MPELEPSPGHSRGVGALLRPHPPALRPVPVEAGSPVMASPAARSVRRPSQRTLPGWVAARPGAFVPEPPGEPISSLTVPASRQAEAAGWRTARTDEGQGLRRPGEDQYLCAGRCRGPIRRQTADGAVAANAESMRRCWVLTMICRTGRQSGPSLCAPPVASPASAASGLDRARRRCGNSAWRRASPRHARPGNTPPPIDAAPDQVAGAPASQPSRATDRPWPHFRPR